MKQVVEATQTDVAVISAGHIDAVLEASERGHKNGKATEPADLPKLSKAEIRGYDDIIKRYSTIVQFGWYELGEAARAIKEHKLWEEYEVMKGEEPFHSFEDYVSRRAHHSRAAIYRAFQLRTGLASVQESDCRQMTQANALLLLHLVKMLDEKLALAPKVIGAALAMTEEQFEEFCNEMLPGAAAIEETETISFKCDKSLAKVVNKALQVAMWDAELDDKFGALERIVTYYLEGKCEHEGLHKLSNREAYTKSKGKKRDV